MFSLLLAIKVLQDQNMINAQEWRWVAWGWGCVRVGGRGVGRMP